MKFLKTIQINIFSRDDFLSNWTIKSFIKDKKF